MPVTLYQAGQLNVTGLVVPGVYPQIVPPQNQVVNGVPSNLLGVVGTASWGPVNAPTIVGTSQEYTSYFGPIVNRKYDAGTVVYAASLQGANNFNVVRVTDGTDTAAAATVQASSTNAITFTSKYTGTFGNSISVSIANGSAANSYAVIIAAPGIAAEKFDNITGSGNALYVNMAAAINGGVNALRGPSNILVATAGSATAAPTVATVTLSGGTDGTTTITSAVLVGNDTTTPRKGMYALRAQGCAAAVLADADDPTQYTLQNAFGLAEGVYMFATGPSGDTISNAVTTKATAGVDSYGMKIVFGDWPQIFDQTNSVYRFIAPSSVLAGARVALSPEQSLLNYPLNGITATQKSAGGTNYTAADIQQLELAGLDVIANPSPGGNYFAAQTGHNTSSNALIHGDNYTSLTNYIAVTLATAAGPFVGKPNTPTLQARAKAVCDTFFLNMQEAGQIDDFQVICDASNNSPSRVALGYLQIDIQIVYFGIVEKILLNIQGGVPTITRVSVTPLAA